MNEYQRFIQDELDKRNWRPADIENRGGPSRQLISKILNSKREVLDQRPKQETVEGLAKVFGISADVVLAHIAKAMGFPLSLEKADLHNASDDDLLEEIRKRMNRESSEHDTANQPANPPQLRAVTDSHHTSDTGIEQKVDDEPALPDPELLAAHPDMPLAADGEDEYFDQLGEDSQES